jgi:hypothetical protein
MTTGIVFIILAATKFVDGAWVIAVAIPLLVYMFHQIHEHYKLVANSLTIEDVNTADMADIANVAIVPIGDVHRGTLRALKYAQRFADDVRAVAIATTPAMHKRIEKRWELFPELTGNIELIVIDYDFRDILTPLVDYIERVNHEEFPNQLITIVIPEFIPASFAAKWLHNQTAGLLQSRLLSEEDDIIVIDVPYHIAPGTQ